MSLVGVSRSSLLYISDFQPRNQSLKNLYCPAVHIRCLSYSDLASAVYVAEQPSPCCEHDANYHHPK